MDSIKVNKIIEEISKTVEEVNRHFLEFIESEDSEEKELLHFFREKYLHFLVYSKLKKKGFPIKPEIPTELKFRINGETERSGNHDLILFHKDQRFAGFEFYLGYDVNSYALDSNDFKKHIESDYKKLIKSKLSELFILNYFYKGRSERSSTGRTNRKEKSYQNHFNQCCMCCEELIKKHKEGKYNKKLNLWIIEGRDDKCMGHGIISFN
jgi:hypothetical protein